MSMRHQIELLFLSLQETISSRLEGIEIIKEKDSKRRTQVKKYHLSCIVASYNAFITASHETDKENLVAQKLIDDGAFDSSEEELTAQFEDYIHYLSKFIRLDEKCWDIYTTNQVDEFGEEIDLGDSQNWLGSENVMVSIFSAIAQFLKNDKKDRVDEAFNKLFDKIDNDHNDPLGLNVFNQVKIGLIYKKANMGFVTRKLIHTGFKEYFRDCGDTSLADCWPQAAE